MNGSDSIRILDSEITKGLAVLTKIEAYILDFQKRKLAPSPGLDEAMILAQALSNYYTCLETMFLRISKFFENNLERDQWHKGLLEKMTLEINGIRPRVISDAVFRDLLEILKFRHFTHYYFELDYDWDKLNFLLKKFNSVHPQVRHDLKTFQAFLLAIESEMNDNH